MFISHLEYRCDLVEEEPYRFSDNFADYEFKRNVLVSMLV